jgi:hypothetical protein
VCVCVCVCVRMPVMCMYVCMSVRNGCSVYACVCERA